MYSYKEITIIVYLPMNKLIIIHTQTYTNKRNYYYHRDHKTKPLRKYKEVIKITHVYTPITD